MEPISKDPKKLDQNVKTRIHRNEWSTSISKSVKI
jgi:hypothetical protein